MSTRPAPPPRSSGVQPLGCLLLVGVGVTIVLVLIWAAAEQETARVAADPLIGQIRAVKPDCDGTIYRDQADHDAYSTAWLDPQAVKDGAPAIIRSGAVRAGRAWVPSAGTRVRIEDHTRARLTVRIVDGIHAGHVGQPASERCLGL